MLRFLANMDMVKYFDRKSVPCMVCLPSYGHRVTMRRLWNMHGTALTSPTKNWGQNCSPTSWKGNTPQAKKAFSSHTPLQQC